MLQMPTDDLTPAQLRAEARSGRRAFATSVLGTFARIMREAMRQFHHMRTDGVSFEDAIKGIEAELRDAWPGRTSKFAEACPTCDDTGYRDLVCSHRMRCNRKRCGLAEETWEHKYVHPCECSAGARFIPKPITQEDALTAVGRSRRPKKTTSWSHVGR